jgi:hypothetical protein
MKTLRYKDIRGPGEPDKGRCRSPPSAAKR